MTRFVNLTPHTIDVQNSCGQFFRISASGDVARCNEVRTLVDTIWGGIEIESVVYGNVSCLPDPHPGTIYITSALVASTVKRPDVLAPGKAIRDEEGKIIGCKGFSYFAT